MSFCFLSACQFNANLTDLNKKDSLYSDSLKSEVFIVPKIQTIIAGQSISFSATGGSNKYSFSILQGAGSINSSTGYFTAGSALETVTVLVTDSNGMTSTATLEIKPQMSLVSTNYEVYTGIGFSYTLPNPTGGIPDYSYTLFSGLGSVLGNQYVPPGTPGTALVKVSDKANSEISINLKIRSFDNKVTQSSGALVAAGSYISNGVEVGSDLIVMAPHYPLTSATWLENYKPNIVAFYKTNDNGATWTHISNFQMREDRSCWGTKLLKNGSKLYLVGYSQIYYLSPISNARVEPFVAESSDNGVTWTVKSTMVTPADADSVYFYNAEIANDNSIVILGQSNKVSSDLRVSFIRKCSLSTWTCIVVYEHMTNDMAYKNGMTAISKDGSGKLYVTHHRYAPTTYTNDIYLKKSTDNGDTWTETLVYNSDSPRTMDVSSDGQTIVIAGTTWVNPAVSHHSYNGGATWTRIVGTSNVCPGWSITQVVIKDSTREVLGGCYNYNMGVYTFYVVRLAYLATSWTNRLTINNSSGGSIIAKNDDTVLISVPDFNNTQVTTDFGTSFVTRTQPTQTQDNDFEFNSIVQAGPTTLYAAGYTGTNIVAERKGVVYISTDSGANWVNDHTFTDVNSYIGGLAVSPTTGTAIGVSRVQTSKWRTIRKPTAGAWGIAETVTFSGSPWMASPVKAYADANGRFITLGSYTSSGNSWHVRVSTDDGLTWSTLDDYRYNGTESSYATAAAFDGTNIWVSGFAKEAFGNSHWLVKKYNGTAWTIEDDFVIPSIEGEQAMANGIMKTADGTIYVVGEYTKLNAFRTWLVRKKSPGSSTWETVDAYQESSKKHAAAMNIVQTADGRIYVSGISEQDRGSLKSAMRVLYPDGWKTVDIWGTYGISAPKSMVPCLTNQLCLVSTTATPAWQYRGLIRILTP